MTDKQPDALAKKLAKALEFDDFISVKLLRQAATLLRTQHKKIAAYELLTKSQEAQLSHHREQSDKYREANSARAHLADQIVGLLTGKEAAPPAQQTVTNDEQASAYMDARLWEFIDMAGAWPTAKPDPRIWAHVMVYAPPAQQPRVGTIGHVSAGKTTLIAAVTPLLKAQQPQEIEVVCPVCSHTFYAWPGEHKVQQPQAEAVQACGHPMSLLLRSAESNEPLYCEACDDKSGRHDAERRETELLDVKRHLQEKIASADALKLHAIEELCQLGYTVKDGELIPPDHLHKLVEAAGHPLTAPQQAAAVPSDVLGAEWVPCIKRPVIVHVRNQRPGEQHVSTREGISPVKPDDLIMRGVSGEEYPIGRAIFEQTYDIAAQGEKP